MGRTQVAGGGGEGDEGEEEDEKTCSVPSILTSDWCTTWGGYLNANKIRNNHQHKEKKKRETEKDGWRAKRGNTAEC